MHIILFITLKAARLSSVSEHNNKHIYFDFMAKRVQITPVLSTNNVLYLTKSYKARGYLTQTERFFLLQARAIVRTSSFSFCALADIERPHPGRTMNSQLINIDLLGINLQITSVRR